MPEITGRKVDNNTMEFDKPAIPQPKVIIERSQLEQRRKNLINQRDEMIAEKDKELAEIDGFLAEMDKAGIVPRPIPSDVAKPTEDILQKDLPQG